MLGCFSAAAQIGGNEYIKTVSFLVNRNVYANQGESAFGKLANFNYVPLGAVPPESSSTQSFYDMGLENAGKFSMASPDGKVNTNVGNIMFDKRAHVIKTKRSSPSDGPRPSIGVKVSGQ